MSWPAVDNAAKYIAELFSDAAGVNLLESQETFGTSVEFEDLEDDTAYYIRVSPVSPQGAITSGCLVQATATLEFTPAILPNLWGDFVADDATIMGGNVNSWTENSAGIMDFAPVTGKEPLKEDNVLNGHSVVKRGSVDASMLLNTNYPNTTSSGITVFMVASQDNAGGLDTTGTFMVAGGILNIQIQRNGGTSGIRAGANTTTGSRIETLSGINEGQFYTFRFITNNTIQRFALNNGTEVTAANVPQTYAATPLQLFATASSAYGNKAFARIIIYTRVLSAGEITQVETYLKDTYAHY